MNFEAVATNFSSEQHSDSFTSPSDIEMLYEYLQVYRSRPGREPEMLLMMAVLEDAIRCYVKYSGAKTRSGKRHFEETRQWFFGPDDDWLFSFENLCGIFSLDPGYIRRGLSQHKQAPEKVVSLPQRPSSQGLAHSNLRLAS
jgi:hypothetical protein